jgi:dienelactone hydrolase
MSTQKTFLMAMVFFAFLFGCTAIQAAAQVSKSLVTGDQVKLDFDFYPAQQPNSPTVILLPDTRCDRRTFGTFPSKLNKAGFNVMAMDLRYKDIIAKARNMPLQLQTIQQQNFDVVIDQDLKSALDFLSTQNGVDLSRICILGTSLGSRVALASGVKYKLKALVLVSLSGEELFTTRKTPIKEVLFDFGDKPILFMSFVKDWGNNYKAPEDNKMYMNWAKGKCELRIWPGSGHGVGFIAISEAEQFVLSWLKQNV